MGDFNIPSITSDLFTAITRRGLKLPKALIGLRIPFNLGAKPIVVT